MELAIGQLQLSIANGQSRTNVELFSVQSFVAVTSNNFGPSISEAVSPVHSLHIHACILCIARFDVMKLKCPIDEIEFES